jgi:flagellar hook-basal body complex protein FliE
LKTNESEKADTLFKNKITRRWKENPGIHESIEKLKSLMHKNKVTIADADTAEAEIREKNGGNLPIEQEAPLIFLRSRILRLTQQHQESEKQFQNALKKAYDSIDRLLTRSHKDAFSLINNLESQISIHCQNLLDSSDQKDRELLIILREWKEKMLKINPDFCMKPDTALIFIKLFLSQESPDEARELLESLPYKNEEKGKEAMLHIKLALAQHNFHMPDTVLEQARTLYEENKSSYNAVTYSFALTIHAAIQFIRKESTAPSTANDHAKVIDKLIDNHDSAALLSSRGHLAYLQCNKKLSRELHTKAKEMQQHLKSRPGDDHSERWHAMKNKAVRDMMEMLDQQ